MSFCIVLRSCSVQRSNCVPKMTMCAAEVLPHGLRLCRFHKFLACHAILLYIFGERSNISHCFLYIYFVVFKQCHDLHSDFCIYYLKVR
jgi:hypothetical protein